jgi:hypothetical protein
MSLWRQLARGVRVFTRRTAADRDVADEVQHYLDEATLAVMRPWQPMLTGTAEPERLDGQLVSAGYLARRGSWGLSIRGEPGHFETIGIPLRRGRLLDARDTAGAPTAVVISESLAARRFRGRDPIGQRVHVGRRDLPWPTVVGVVGDVKQTSLGAADPDAVYVSPAQWYFADRAMWLVVRAGADATALAPAIRQAIWSVDKTQPIVRVALITAALGLPAHLPFSRSRAANQPVQPSQNCRRRLPGVGGVGQIESTPTLKPAWSRTEERIASAGLLHDPDNLHREAAQTAVAYFATVKGMVAVTVSHARMILPPSLVTSQKTQVS